MESLLEEGRSRSLPLFKQAVIEYDATTLVALRQQAESLIRELNTKEKNVWHFKKAVELMEIGKCVHNQEYIDFGWSFLNKL